MVMVMVVVELVIMMVMMTMIVRIQRKHISTMIIFDHIGSYWP